MLVHRRGTETTEATQRREREEGVEKDVGRNSLIFSIFSTLRHLSSLRCLCGLCAPAVNKHF